MVHETRPISILRPHWSWCRIWSGTFDTAVAGSSAREAPDAAAGALLHGPRSLKAGSTIAGIAWRARAALPLEPRVVAMGGLAHDSLLHVSALPLVALLSTLFYRASNGHPDCIEDGSCNQHEQYGLKRMHAALPQRAIRAQGDNPAACGDRYPADYIQRIWVEQHPLCAQVRKGEHSQTAHAEQLA